MRLLLSFKCLCFFAGLAYAQADSPLMHPLVGITFALSNGRAFTAYVITKSGIGWSEWVEPGDSSTPNEIVIGGAKSGHIRDTNATEKATQSLKLLKGLAQPKHLPESPNQVLTARWLEGNKVVERRFPAEQVPSEIRQILLLMRCPERDLKLLKFTQTPMTNATPQGP